MNVSPDPTYSPPSTGSPPASPGAAAAAASEAARATNLTDVATSTSDVSAVAGDVSALATDTLAANVKPSETNPAPSLNIQGQLVGPDEGTIPHIDAIKEDVLQIEANKNQQAELQGKMQSETQNIETLRPTPEQKRAPLPNHVRQIQAQTFADFKAVESLRGQYSTKEQALEQTDAKWAAVEKEIELSKGMASAYLQKELTATAQVPVTTGTVLEGLGKVVPKAFMPKKIQVKARDSQEVQRLSTQGGEINKQIQGINGEITKIKVTLRKMARMAQMQTQASKLKQDDPERDKLLADAKSLADELKGSETVKELTLKVEVLENKKNALKTEHGEALSAYNMSREETKQKDLRQQIQGLVVHRQTLQQELNPFMAAQDRYQNSLKTLAGEYISVGVLPSRDDIPNAAFRQEVVQEILAQVSQGVKLSPDSQSQWIDRLAQHYFDEGALPPRPSAMKNPAAFEKVLSEIAQKCFDSPDGYYEEASEGSGEVYFLGKKVPGGTPEKPKIIRLFVWKPSRKPLGERSEKLSAGQINEQQLDAYPPDEDSQREYLADRLSGSTRCFAYTKLQDKKKDIKEGYLCEHFTNAGSIMTYAYVAGLTRGKVMDVKDKQKSGALTEKEANNQITALKEKEKQTEARGKAMGLEDGHPSSWPAFKNLPPSIALDLQRQTIRHFKLGNHDQNLGNILIQTTKKADKEVITRFVAIDPARGLGKVPYRDAQQHLFRITPFDQPIDQSIALEEIYSENVEETWNTLHNLNELMPQSEKKIQLTKEGIEFNIAHRYFLRTGCECGVPLNKILAGFDLNDTYNCEMRQLNLGGAEPQDVNMVRYFYEGAKSRVAAKRAAAHESPPGEGQWDQELWDVFQGLCREHFKS